MSGNLSLWQKYEDIDPKFTKPISGRDYGGTSPNPQYVIMCLTDMFGPCGKGFGWNVLAEEFKEMNGTYLHWCRIRFWWKDEDGVHSVEEYGQTKAAYVTSKGVNRVDEDAPKKSLTDAIIKGASHIGIAANIFLGRWDDQKYVAEVNREYRDEERKASNDRPPFNADAAAKRIEASIRRQNDVASLNALYSHEKGCISDIEAADKRVHAKVMAAFASRKKEVAQKEAA